MIRRAFLLSLCLLPLSIVSAQTPEMVAVNSYLIGTSNGCIISADGANANGTAYIQATDGAGHPFPFKSVIGGNSYQSVGNAIQRPIANGVLASVSLQWVTGAGNQKIPYTFTFNVNGHTTVYSNVDISPQAGATFDWCSANLAGNLINGPITIKGDPGTVTATGVNGDFLVPGTLTANGLSALSATINNLSSSVNGVFNAAFGTGTDICAKATNGFATNKHVFIAQGNYSCSTTLQIPSVQNPYLEMDPLTTITYTGTDTAIEWLQAGHLLKISGGKIIGNSSARSGIRLDGAAQGYVIDGTVITGFTNGDCFINRGVNVGMINNADMEHCLVGVHLMGRPSFAVNLNVIHGGTYINNGWGAIDGDVSQYPSSATYGGGGVNWGGPGVQSPNFGNTFEDADWEANTSGGIWLVLTSSAKIIGGYFEGLPEAVKLGEATPVNITAYQNLYGVATQNGGTNIGTLITGTFMNDGAIAHEVEISAAARYSVFGNSISTVATCFMDLTSGSWQPGWLGPNSYSIGTAPACLTGTPGGPVANTLEYIDPTNGLTMPQINLLDGIYFGSSNYLSTGMTVFKINSGGPPRAGHGGSSNFCTPGWTLGSVWVDKAKGAFFLCQADSIAPGGGAAGNSADGNGTWVEMTYKAQVN